MNEDIHGSGDAPDWETEASARAERMLSMLDPEALSHPLVGFSTGATASAGAPAPVSSHVLVTGPTGSGKSRRVLSSAILSHDGPVMAVSSKPDLVDLCSEGRITAGGAGRTRVLDLSGMMRQEKMPEGSSKVYLDPTRFATDDDSALDLATIMVEAANGESLHDPFWTRATVPIVAALLRAAGSDGIQWAAAAVNTLGERRDVSRHPEMELIEKLEAANVKLREGRQPDFSAGEPRTQSEYRRMHERVKKHQSSLWTGELTEDLPEFVPDQRSWFDAAARLQLMGSYRLSAVLRGWIGAKAEKMTDSLQALARSAFSAWLRTSLARPDGGEVLTPEMMTHPRSTLFVVSPPDGVSAPAAVMALDMVASRWRDNQYEDLDLPTLLMVIDEVTNTAPWAKLPVVVTEARSMGVHVLAAVQSTTQFARRFGDAGMDELRRIFPSVMLMVGASEVELMDYHESKLLQLERYSRASIQRPHLPMSRDEALLIHNAPPTNDAERLLAYQIGETVSLRDVSMMVGRLSGVDDDLVADHRRERDEVVDVDALVRQRMSVVEREREEFTAWLEAEHSRETDVGVAMESLNEDVNEISRSPSMGPEHKPS